MRLADTVAIVTGGGTGIGEAIAKAFAWEGAKVAITGRRMEELDRVVKDIGQRGGHALALRGSVTQEQDVRDAVESTVQTFGHLDILVNNAGNLFYAGPLHETPDKILDETFDLFMKGPFRFIRAAIPHMLRQGGGSILNISTVGALKAIPNFEGHAYQAAKAGLVMLTKTVAMHYAKRHIRCNCLCPAGVITPGTASMLNDPQTKAWFEGLHPMGRLGQPQEIADAAIYFASDESRWTTGSILPIDGGMTAG
jgi:NAD(P)-dependent dehydrogenase (short-subunit alcohol dehydrogenase family)